MWLHNSYKKAFTILEDGDKVSGENLLTSEEMKWIMGGTIQDLFPGAW